MGQPWYRWLCLQQPREPQYNPVTGQTVADPPYYRCRDVNHSGDCPLFKEGPTDIMKRRKAPEETK